MMEIMTDININKLSSVFMRREMDNAENNNDTLFVIFVLHMIFEITNITRLLLMYYGIMKIKENKGTQNNVLKNSDFCSDKHCDKNIYNTKTDKKYNY